MIGVLVNCCEPESISKTLNGIRSDKHVNQYLQHPLEPTSPTEAHYEGLNKIFLGAYANRLTPVDPEWTLESSEEAQAMRDDLSPEKYYSFVKLWQSGNQRGNIGEEVNKGYNQIGGMQLIGGCCGISPGYISVLRDCLKKQEN